MIPVGFENGKVLKEISNRVLLTMNQQRFCCHPCASQPAHPHPGRRRRRRRNPRLRLVGRSCCVRPNVSRMRKRAVVVESRFGISIG